MVCWNDTRRKLLSSDESDMNNLLKIRAASVEQEISDLQRILAFIEKVIDFGLPDMNAEVINAQVSGEGDNATVAITTVNGETFIYKWNGQLLRR